MKKLLWFIPLLFVVGLWEIVSSSGLISPALFPPPSKVAVALWSMIQTGTIFIDLRDSLWRLCVGLLLGSIIGVVVGLLTGRIKYISSLVMPIIQVLRPLPPVAIIPLIIVWFGIDNGAKIFSIAFAVFFPVWINAHIGAEQIPKAFIWSAKLLTNSFPKVFRRVFFPATLPFVVAGIRTGIAVAFIMVFVSELAGASTGLGYRISITHSAYRIDEMMAALVVLGGLGAVADQVFIFAVRRFSPWLKLNSI